MVFASSLNVAEVVEVFTQEEGMLSCRIMKGLYFQRLAENTQEV
jgi:hypothetical protein